MGKGKTTIQELKLADVIPTPDNPRVITEKDDAFKELVASVKGAGVLVPVHVRPHPKHRGKWDLRAGERRIRAAQAAGLETIPAIVHEGMTDAEAFELTFTENFVREDLTPLEQGRAVEILMEQHNDDVGAVAAHLGRSRKWVALRGRLSQLSKGWRKALADPKRFCSDWGIGHLEVIARHEPELQEGILKEIGRDWEHIFRNYRVQQLATFIEEKFTHLLRTAPWKIDDEIVTDEIVRTGRPFRCALCSRRSSAQADLFDLGKGGKDDRCLDESCWQKKMAAYLAQRVGELRKKHADLVLVGGAGCHISGCEKEFEERYGAKPLGSWDYDEVKKSDKKAKPALVVDGAGTGHLKWVRPRRGAKAERATGEAKPKTLKERRAALQKRREVRALADFRKLAEKATIEHEDYNITLIALAAGFGVKHSYSDPQGWSCFDGLEKKIARETKVINSPGQQKIVADELWRRVLPNLLSPLNPSYTTTSAIQHAERLAQLLSLDFDACLKAAVDAIPEPKLWATLKADGTPKKTRGKRRKKARESKQAKPEKKSAKANKKAGSVKRKRGRPRKGICRVCGCTETSPCPGGCAWTDKSQTLCTACEDPNNPGKPLVAAKSRRSRDEDGKKAMRPTKRKKAKKG